MPEQQRSVFRITSAVPKNTKFGTGFVCGSEDGKTLLITCAHVIEDVGGVDNVRVDGNPVDELIAMGNSFSIDLAVFTVHGLHGSNGTEIPILTLCGEGKEQLSVMLFGFSDFIKGQYISRELKGKLAGAIEIETVNGFIPAWDLDIDVQRNRGLKPGYSGSPIWSQENGNVVAVVSHRQGEDAGYALDISNLLKLNSNMSNRFPDLLSSNQNNWKESHASQIASTRQNMVGKRITGRDMELLHQVLTQAFPREETLSQFLRFRMDLNSEFITQAGSVSTRVFELIQYLDSQYRIEELLIEAPRFNPHYPLLAQVCKGIQERVFGSIESVNPINLLDSKSTFQETIPLPRRSEIFICYSRKDREWVDQLHTFLKPLVKENSIVLWDDSKILPGDRWYPAIERAIEQACIAILMVTSDFLASSFIDKEELPRILAAEKDGLKVLWIAVRPSLVKKTEIAQFQAVNDPDRPLSTMSMAIREEEMVTIATRISNAVDIVMGKAITEE